MRLCGGENRERKGEVEVVRDGGRGSEGWSE